MGAAGGGEGTLMQSGPSASILRVAIKEDKRLNITVLC